MLGVALVTGTVQASMEGWLRPAAVFTQVELGVGKYAQRFARGLTEDYRWFVSNGDALRGRVLVGENPEIQDVLVFRGIKKAALDQVVMAETARPGATPETWELTNARIWEPSPGGRLVPRFEETATIAFPLRGAHLEYLDVGGFYIPQEALDEIASVESTPMIADVKTAQVRRFAAFFLPGIFALLGANLAQAGAKGRVLSPLRLVGFAVVGYVSVVSVKVFWTLGEFGELSALWANLGSLLIAATIAGVLIWRKI